MTIKAQNKIIVENSALSETLPVVVPARVYELAVDYCAYLEMRSKGEDIKRIPLDKKESIIGRASSCGVRIESPTVSRVHAIIKYMNEEYIIEDMDSTNGTFVNGVRVKKCVLRDNDQIQVGQVSLLFVEEKVRRSW